MKHPMAAPSSSAPVTPAAVPAARPLVPFQRPEPPTPSEILAYYQLAEDARYHAVLRARFERIAGESGAAS